MQIKLSNQKTEIGRTDNIAGLNSMLSSRDSPVIKNTNSLKVKRLEKILQTNSKQKRTGATILSLDKIDFKIKKLQGTKKATLYQEKV